MMKLCRDYSHTGFHSDCAIYIIYYTVEAIVWSRGCYNLYNDLQCAQCLPASLKCRIQPLDSMLQFNNIVNSHSFLVLRLIYTIEVSMIKDKVCDSV